MANSKEKISVYEAWKILLGVLGALAGVAVIVLLLAIVLVGRIGQRAAKLESIRGKLAVEHHTPGVNV